MLNSNFSVGDMNFNYRLKLETLSKHALASSMGLCNVQCKSLQSALKFHLSALFGIDWQAFSPSKHAVIIYWTLYLIICEGFCAGLPADCNAQCNYKKIPCFPKRCAVLLEHRIISYLITWVLSIAGAQWPQDTKPQIGFHTTQELGALLLPPPGQELSQCRIPHPLVLWYPFLIQERGSVERVSPLRIWQ